MPATTRSEQMSSSEGIGGCESGWESIVGKLQRLVDRFYNNLVVPFLGAGVSYKACPDGLTRTPEMTKKFAAELLKAAESSHELKVFLNGICKSETEVCLDQLSKLGLAVLAEIFINLYDVDEAHQLLRITEFANIESASSHKYIAYIVREGFIEEIITTNYDCCMEKAYIESFPKPVRNTNQVRVVTGLFEYRRFQNNHNQNYPLLHLYKINGCAGKYNDSHTNQCEHSKVEIVLTERQLQTWRRNKWAKDMFRDRCRIKSILFSGFGSEEPQIRHTVLQVMEEFEDCSEDYSLSRNSSDEDQDRKENPWENNNSPFIAEWGDLTFYQYQILCSYLRAHGQNRIKIDDVREAAFTKRDKALFDQHLEFSGENLEMEQFWGVIYWLLLKKLLAEKYFIPESVLGAYLPIGGMSGSLFREFFQDVLAVGRGADNLSHPLEKAFRALFRFDPEADSKGKDLPASRLHHNLIYPEHEYESGEYIAFRDEPVALCMLYLLWWLCYRAFGAEKSEEWPRPSAAGSFLVYICSTTKETISWPVYVCGEKACYRLTSSRTSFGNISNLAGLVFVLNGKGLAPQIVPVKQQINNEIQFIQLYFVPDVYCFQGAQSLDDVISKLKNLIHDPGVLQSKSLHWKQWVEEIR